MYRNWKLKRKLLAGFIIVAILSALGGIVASTAMRYIDRDYSAALRNYGFAQGDIGEAMLEIAQIESDTIKVISYTEQDDIESARDDVTARKAAYDDYAEAVYETLDDDTSLSIYDSISSLATRYFTLRSEIVSQIAGDADSMLAAQLRVEDELDPIYEEFYSTWEELADYKRELGDAESERLTVLSDRMLFLSNILCVAGWAASILVGIFLANTISKPVKAGAERIVKFSQGDFKSPVPEVRFNDETGDVINASAKAIENLNRVISDIDYQLDEMGKGNFTVETRDEGAYVGDLAAVLTSLRNISHAVNNILLQVELSVEHVNSGGEQVSSGAQALAQGATEQASSVEELAATISEISDKINTTAQEARTAQEENRNSEEALSVCSGYMNDLVSAMRVIDGRSHEISTVIKTIEDIAFQTNILALNAAVEAARAGSAGKGFAVVADEVRNLANRSQEAAQSTTTLIDETVSSVQEGTRLTGETEHALEKVVLSVRKVLNAVTLISSATDEEAASLSQVSTGIDQISSVVQTNSATAEESAAASQELSGQANLLKAQIDKFTLKR